MLTSAFGTMFFGDRVATFTNVRRGATPDARMAIVRWRTLAENPRMEAQMTAVAPNLPPRPKPVPNEPGMFAFADPQHVTEVLIAAGWAPPRFEKLDMDLDIAAGRGLEEGCRSINRNRRCEPFVRTSRHRSSRPPSPLRAALAPYADGMSVRLPDEVDRQLAGLNEHCSTVF